MGYFTDKTSKKIEFDKLKIVSEDCFMTGYTRYRIMYLPKGKWDISRNWRCHFPIFGDDISRKEKLVSRKEKLVRECADEILEQGYLYEREEYTNTEWP